MLFCGTLDYKGIRCCELNETLSFLFAGRGCSVLAISYGGAPDDLEIV